MILFDDAVSGRTTLYAEPLAIIRADDPAEVAPAIAAMQAAQAEGRHLAGFFSYELGYALEPKLAGLLPSPRRLPLLWFGVFAEARKGMIGEGGRGYAGPLRWEWSEADYAARFAKVRDWIMAGDIYQANLSMRGRFRAVGDAQALFRAIRASAGAAHGAYVDAGDFQILSFSPELFFDLAGDGTIVTRPMKGTAARGRDPLADQAARLRLASNAKDRAENLMIVDLLRNDLSRIAASGSVAVERLFEVETYPTLHQMVSTVTARLAAGTGIGRILEAIFPSGSITGAPKIRAMQIIAELEASPRGVYCGAIGHFSPDGSARFNVAIRTLTIADGWGELGAGGAVVADSRSHAEYAECLLKARYFEASRRPLQLIETLRREDGRFERLELHLDRLAAGARHFAFPFDRAAAKAALDSVAGAGRLRVRLTLDEEGGLAVAADPLPPAPDSWRFAIARSRWHSGDPLLRYKTSWRDVQDSELAASGADEVLFLNERDELCEGSRSSLFLVRDGVWRTPASTCGLLEGCLRQEMLSDGKCREAVLTLADLDAADEVWFGNSLRGLIRALPLTPP
jgi:para-aminobenzoate synthetase/4-amino-4-deoxychorismate lyase